MSDLFTETQSILCSLSESDLQAKVVEPLLRAMNFSHVRNNSGTGEYGKGIVAIKSEFGQSKLYAIQLKKFKLSGKHNHPEGLPYVLGQVVQSFSEKVVDPITNEYRLPDRCVFITPYTISRSAFTSSANRMKELERREITVIDGTQLAELALAHISRELSDLGTDARYKASIVSKANQVREVSAFGLSTGLLLDDIYVELFLGHGSAKVYSFISNFAPKKGRIVEILSQAEEKELEYFWRLWAGETKAAAFDKRPRDNEIQLAVEKLKKSIASDLERDRARLHTLSRRSEGELERNALRAHIEELESASVGVVDAGTMANGLVNSVQTLLEGYSKVEQDSVSPEAATEIMQKGVSLFKNIERFIDSQLTEVCFEERKTKRAANDFQVRLTPTALLKIEATTFVVGPSGAGKTTLIRRLVQTMGRSNNSRLPVVVSLLQFNREKFDSIEAAIARELAAHGVRHSGSQLHNALSAGKYRVFLDGLDEAAESITDILVGLVEFNAQYPRCPLLVTAREILADKFGENALRIRVLPFTIEQLRTLVERWFPAEPTKQRKLKAWFDENTSLQAVSRTPLVAAVLCSLMQVDAELPTTEIELYEPRFELFLGKWEKAKGMKYMPLERRTTYLHYLMRLAFRTHDLGDKVFTRSAAVEIAHDYYEQLRFPAAGSLVNDCLYRSLLETEGADLLSFGHLTYQEYLVARLLSHDNPTKFVAQRIGKVWWDKVLKMYATMRRDITSVLQEPTAVRAARFHPMKELVALAPATSSGEWRRYTRKCGQDEASVRLRDTALSAKAATAGNKPAKR